MKYTNAKRLTDSERREPLLVLDVLPVGVEEVFRLEVHGLLPVLWVPVAGGQVGQDVGAARQQEAAELDVAARLVPDAGGGEVGEAVDLGHGGAGVGEPEY